MDSDEPIILEDQGSYDLFRKQLPPDGFAGLKRLKSLRIRYCKTEECLANAPATIVFPVLEKLDFYGLPNLREICRGPAPEGSFGKLTFIKILKCHQLEYLFPLQIVGCLTQLQRLHIINCELMEEVIRKEQGDARIEFRNLEFLYLEELPNLVGFCKGIHQIDFPKLKCMHLGVFRQFERFIDESSLPSNSEQNFDVGSPPLFPRKVTFPCLEDLILQALYNMTHECYVELLIRASPTLKKLEVSICDRLRYVFHSSVARLLVHLKELKIRHCWMMEAVVDWEEEIDGGHPVPGVTFPCLEDLILQGLHNWGDKYFSELLINSFSTVKKLEVDNCNIGVYVFHSSLAGHLVHLKELNISNCGDVEAVFRREDEIEDGQERKVDTTLFPQLSKLQLNDLPKLRRFCHFIHTLDLPMLSELDIRECPSMEEFSLGHVSTPNLSLSGISWNGILNPDISWNGDLNNALRLLQEFSKKRNANRISFNIRSDGETDRRLLDEMDLDIYDSESDSCIERNNNTITWRATLPPNPQRGQCICFRTADLYTDTSVITRLYSVPFDLFGDGGDDDASSSNPGVEGLEPFYKCTDFATTSTLSSVGSSLFVVGGSKETGPCRVSITTEKMYQFDTAASENGWNWYELSMCTPRAFPITVAMDGKLYIFGGSGPDPPLAELFDPGSESSTCVPLPPVPSGFHIDGWRHLVVAALQPSKKILVASGLSLDAYVYNVVDQGWEKFDHEVDFSSVRGQAAVVQNGNALCWCSNNVEEVHAYHLVHKRWFKSSIQGLDKVGMRDLDEPTHDCLLFPLDDNHLCLLWKDHMGYDGTNLPLLHCIKIRVLMARGRSIFDAVASRTYALGPDESIFDAHVFLGDHDHGGRTWERSGYGDGPKTVSSIASFKICFKCWGTGHTESSCDQVESEGPAQVPSARGLALGHSKK